MAERRFTVRLDAEMNISQVKSAVQTMQTELSKLNLPQDIGSKLTGTFGKLTGEIERFQAMSAKGIGSSKDFSQLERSGNKILQLYEQLRGQVSGLGSLSDSQLSKLFPQAALNNIKKANDAYKTYTSTVEKNSGAITKQQTAIKNQQAKIEELRQTIAKVQGMQIVPKQKDLDGLATQVAAAKSEFDGLEAEVKQTQNKIDELTGKLKHPEKSKQIAALQQQLTTLQPQVEQARSKWQGLQNQFNNTTTVSRQSKELQSLQNQLINARGSLDTFTNELAELQAVDAGALQNLIAALNQIPGIKIDPITTSLEEIQRVIARLSQGEIDKLRTSFLQVGNQVDGAGGTFDRFNKEIDETGKKVNQLDSQMGEVGMLKSRISYFFGLTNSVYLLRRALSSAFETVKELDKTMTEAAVVTDFSVGDMWDKLPQYANEANKLGTSINSLYAATTLYYQQGLKTNEAMNLGIETMKMARIAGMESAEATEAMTAALRGFNMELNEASATRVNDVYSKLAAITASDTEQIATAMTKTASIANAANMEFETTAALLAQIIETTQEAPETAGTAMKTIIARFTEVKELFSQGQLTGEDSEGEEININKIDEALKTVGISLKDFLNGSKGIDDIFLELAEKWDSLDLATQRYIATMAAGSRQQSRFIAMMSDYDRTMELVGAANNSAGASQQQFNKTLESLDSKLEKLGVAWDTFLMGIADNEIIKDMIDLLTDFIILINKITTLGGKSSDSFSIITKLGLTVVALRGAKAILGKGIASLVSSFTSAGSEAGVGFFQGLSQSFVLRGNRSQNFAKDLKLAFDPIQYADTSGGGRLAVQQNMQALGQQYHLTSGQVDELTESMANGNSATQTSTAFLQKNSLALKQQRLQMLKTTVTIIGVVVAIAIVLKMVEHFKEKVDNTYNTTSEQLEQIATMENELIESTTKLSDTMSELADTKTEFNGLISKLKTLKRGSMEWATSMHQVRTKMTDILEKYPELMNYTKLVSGVRVLTNEGWAEYEKALLETYQNQMSNLYATKILKIQTEKVNKAESLNLKTSTVTGEEEAGIQKGKTYGGYVLGAAGAVGGYAIGTKIGGAIGSAIAPGIGTAIGAFLGAALGGAIGGWFGGEYSATEGIDPNIINKAGESAFSYKNENGSRGFSAQQAISTSEDGGSSAITKFLTDSGLEEGTEDFEAMFKYISENAKEFDEHTHNLAKSNTELIEFGRTLGAINAEKRGITGEAAETYEGIVAGLTAAEFSIRYNNELSKLKTNVSNKGIETISEKEFTLTSQEFDGLRQEFLKAYGGEDGEFMIDPANNKIISKTTKAEITDAVFLGKIATSRVNMDIDESATEILKLSKHTADNQLLQWAYDTNGEVSKDDYYKKIVSSYGLGSNNLDEMKGLLLQGYKTLELAASLPQGTEALQWKVFQEYYGKEGETNPVNYIFETYRPNVVNDKPGLYSTEDWLPFTRVEGISSGVENPVASVRATTKDPNNYKSPAAWIGSHVDKRYDKRSEGTGTAIDPIKYKAVLYDQTNYRYKGFEIPDEEAYYDAIKSIYPALEDNWMAYILASDGKSGDFQAQMDQLLGDYNLMLKYTKDSYKEVVGYDAAKGELQYGTEAKSGYGFSFLEGVDWATAVKFVEMVEGIVGAYAIDMTEFSDFFNNIAKSIPTIEGALDESLRDFIFSQVAATDLSDLNDLRRTRNLIQTQGEEYGIDTTETLKVYDNFTKRLEELQIAVSDIDIEQLIKTLEESTKVANKIRKEDESKNIVFSKEELDSLISAGMVNRNDFFLTEDGYIYLGDSMAELRNTILETNNILLGMQVDALRAKIKTGDDLINAGVAGYSWGAVSTWDQQTIGALFQDFGEKYGFTAGTKGADGAWTGGSTDEEIRAAVKGTPLEALDIGVIRELMSGNFDLLEETTAQAVREILKGWGDSIVNYQTYSTQLTSGLSDTKQSQLAAMNMDELQYIKTGYGVQDAIADGKLTVGNKLTFTDIDGNAVEGEIQDNGTIKKTTTQNVDYQQKVKDGKELTQAEQMAMERDLNDTFTIGNTTYKVTGDYTYEATTTDTYGNIFQNKDGSWSSAEGETPTYSAAEVEQALDAKIQQNDLEAAYNTTAKEFEGTEVEGDTKRIKQHTIAAHESAKAIDEMNQEIANQKEALEDVGSERYDVAISKIADQAKEAFGEHVDAQFVKDNIKWFKQLAEGGEAAAEAWRHITQAAAAKLEIDPAFLNGLDTAGLSLEWVQGIADQIDGANLEMGVGMDMTNFLEGMKVTEQNAEILSQYLLSRGYKVVWTQTGEDENGLPLFEGTVEKLDLGGTGLNPYTGGGKDEWENPYDKLHDTLEEINDLLRERERLERRYQHLIDRGTKSVTDVQNARQAQLKNLEQENALQEEIIAGRNQQIDELLAKNSKMQKYVQTEDLGNGERSIRIDWAAIEKVRSNSTGEKIDEFYDKLKEYLESIYDAEKTIIDNQDEQYDLLQEGKDEYFDLEDQVKEAIIEGYQKQIDELSNINDSVNDTNSRLLEAMQEQLDEYRQNRDNERTEEEIADKQRRLAYLSQDTSGANATEILALQKEIDEAQEDYTDTLIDQKISELQKQNDLAAEQRQRQIEIAQAQLEHYEKTGGVWEEVDKLLSGAIGPDGEVLFDSKLMELLKEANSYTGLSEIGQMKWLSGIETMISQAFGWRDGKGVLSTFWNGKDIEFTTADGQIVKGKVGEDGKVTAEDGSIYEHVQWLGGNQFKTDEKFKIKEEEKKEAEEPEEPKEPKEPKGKNYRYVTTWEYMGTEYKSEKEALQAAEKNAIRMAQALQKIGKHTFHSKNYELEIGAEQSKITTNTKKVSFKTGGLADFTGPAWLDGTKSKPEYILNADQTKAFFNLVDVLSSLQTKPSQTTEKSGDNTYDIDINVESIGSDYDVEQLAETVKRLINDDARYRNNNAINLMR